jgi:hypothetical protein
MRLRNTFRFNGFVRTMDSLDLTNPLFWGSLVVGAVVVAAVSYGFQMGKQEDSGEPINQKGLVRDGLLGAIFTAMAWNLVPDSMKSLTDSVSVTVSTAASTVAETASSTVSKTADIDLQVGPARF